MLRFTKGKVNLNYTSVWYFSGAVVSIYLRAGSSYSALERSEASPPSNLR